MARKVSFNEMMVGNYSTANVMQLVRSAKQRAELKSVPFAGLDEIFFHVQKELQDNNNSCACCKKSFQRKTDGKGGGGKDSLSIHRVKASLGYVPENLKVICQACNNAIGEINEESDIQQKIAALEWQKTIF